MKFTLGVCLLVVSFGAMAGEAVQLDDLKLAGSKATGTCGAARVSVSGVGADFIEFAGQVDVVSGSSKLTLAGEQAPFFFQDRNQVACVQTPKGPMLVVKASCDGSSCIPDDFRVIDPKTAAVLPVGAEADGCDTACAEQVLGMRLPQGFRPGHAN